MQRAYTKSDALVPSGQGGVRLTPEEIKHRLSLGKEMKQLSDKTYEDAVKAGATPGKARQQAIIARENFAIEHRFQGVQRDDYMTVAIKFDHLDLDDLSLLPWETLRNLRMSYVGIEYAEKLIKLFVHGQKHPGCPNSLPTKSGTVKLYMQQNPAELRDVDRRLAGLEEELRFFADNEGAITYDFTKRQNNIINFIKEKTMPATPIQAASTATNEELLELIRTLIKEQSVPVLTSIQKLAPDLKEYYDEIFKTALSQIQQNYQTRITSLTSEVQGTLDEKSEHIAILEQLAQAKDGRIGTLESTIATLNSTISDLYNRTNEQAQALRESAQALKDAQAEARQNWQIAEVHKNTTLKLHEELVDALNQKELAIGQTALLVSHIDTLKITQQTIPALLDTYRSQITELQKRNELAEKDLEIHSELRFQAEEEAKRLRKENESLRSMIDKIRNAI